MAHENRTPSGLPCNLDGWGQFADTDKCRYGENGEKQHDETQLVECDTPSQLQLGCCPSTALALCSLHKRPGFTDQWSESKWWYPGLDTENYLHAFV